LTFALGFGQNSEIGSLGSDGRLLCFRLEMTRLGLKAERERYYLLPGMGGKASKRKSKLFLQLALGAGLLVSGVVAGLLYFLYVR
jgi:hypothetical protein